MSDISRKQNNSADAIEDALNQCGGTTPELDRLAKVSNDIQRLEWLLARRSPGAAELDEPVVRLKVS